EERFFDRFSFVTTYKKPIVVDCRMGVSVHSSAPIASRIRLLQWLPLSCLWRGRRPARASLKGFGEPQPSSQRVRRASAALLLLRNSGKNTEFLRKLAVVAGIGHGRFET